MGITSSRPINKQYIMPGHSCLDALSGLGYAISCVQASKNMHGSTTLHILIVDDDPKLTEAVSWYLEAEGFRATRVANGTKALETFRADKPDAIILDVMMPGMDGFELCRAIRRESKVPIMMLSAREGEADKVRALNLGADDYVTKPFGAMELVARIRALVRRAGDSAGGYIQSPGMDIFPEQRKVLVQGSEAQLSALEFDLLLTLVRRPQVVFSRDQLADFVWGQDFSGDLRLIDSHIYRLREKLIQAGLDPCPIATVRGVGYAFRPEA
jgi:DNA-binding response OmpR family regulator